MDTVAVEEDSLALLGGMQAQVFQLGSGTSDKINITLKAYCQLLRLIEKN